MKTHKKSPPNATGWGKSDAGGETHFSSHFIISRRYNQIQTPLEVLGHVARLGGWLEVDRGALALHSASDPAPALAAALKRHEAALLRYVAAFPDGRWPGWRR